MIGFLEIFCIVMFFVGLFLIVEKIIQVSKNNTTTNESNDIMEVVGSIHRLTSNNSFWNNCVSSMTVRYDHTKQKMSFSVLLHEYYDHEKGYQVSIYTILKRWDEELKPYYICSRFSPKHHFKQNDKECCSLDYSSGVKSKLNATEAISQIKLIKAQLQAQYPHDQIWGTNLSIAIIPERR